MPMAVNTFSFEDVLALFFFLVLLTPAQRRSLRSLHLFWCTGVDQNRFSGSNRWNNWLSAPNLLDWLSGVRVLHVSVTIGCESELHGPLVTALTRSTYYDSTINTWVFGLKRFRKLPLEKVTVIVSDDPGSRFGKTRGHAQHGNGWLLLRQRYCLTAHEKRTTAQNLRSEILKQTVEDGGANPV
ncbi:hypothetical protein EJ04DRAFT_352877 [Polyplosphaeria fusca]|uniref:Uncharacterized protein n=1 Tax=Polyplosphaeria fusca TaxID=682080 RepID=A0A9P4V0E3_9PLEO|nr:hypothetical protein EJ04DRAFT_352877 [Polyplosphaeria fusca]